MEDKRKTRNSKTIIRLQCTDKLEKTRNCKVVQKVRILGQVLESDYFKIIGNWAKHLFDKRTFK